MGIAFARGAEKWGQQGGGAGHHSPNRHLCRGAARRRMLSRRAQSLCRTGQGLRANGAWGARLGREGSENRDDVAIDLTLEGNDEFGKLGHARPAPGLELGLVAIARRDVDFAFLAEKTPGKPLLALPAVAAADRHAQQTPRQAVASAARL